MHRFSVKALVKVFYAFEILIMSSQTLSPAGVLILTLRFWGPSGPRSVRAHTAFRLRWHGDGR